MNHFHFNKPWTELLDFDGGGIMAVIAAKRIQIFHKNHT